jgi:hypothetical protein
VAAKQVHEIIGGLRPAALAIGTALIAACGKDVYQSSVWGFRLVDDDGVPAFAWIRHETRCHVAANRSQCLPEHSIEFFDDGWAFHSQIDESEPLSFLPEPMDLPLGSWSGWEPQMRFDMAAGHRWQLVWSAADSATGAPAKTFLIHDGVVNNLDIELEDDAELLARADDTATLIAIVGAASESGQEVRLLQLSNTAQILADERIGQLEWAFGLDVAHWLHARLVGDELLVGVRLSRSDDDDEDTTLIYRDGLGEVVDIGLDGVISALWGDSDRTRVMITTRAEDPNILELILVDVGVGMRRLAPDSGSACDDPLEGDFLPNGDAVYIFGGGGCPGRLVVPEAGAPWTWDIPGFSTVQDALGTSAGLLVFQTTDGVDRIDGEVRRESQAAVLLLDVGTHEATPLFDVDLTPGGRLNEQR